MDLFNPTAIRELCLFAPPFILSLSFHEFSHAWVADKLGDPTARYMGRLTMDPMAHASILGTFVLPAFAVLTGAPLFGWANPVPVDMRNFRRPRLHMAITAAAGPVSNLFLATLCTALISLVAHYGNFMTVINPLASGIAGAGVEMLFGAVNLNLFLAVFNLIPLPPLDGSKIVQGLVSPQTADKLDAFAQQSQWLLLILFISGLLSFLVGPVLYIRHLLMLAFGVPLI